MESLSGLTPLFTAGIFLISFLALLLAGINYMLNPLKENQVGLGKRMDRLEGRMDRMEIKLDQLIAANSA